MEFPELEQDQGTSRSCTARRRGVAYQLRLEVRQGCLEATVKAHTRSNIFKGVRTSR